MDQLFIKRLADVIKQSRTANPSEQLTFYSQLQQELKGDFKGKNEQLIQQGLLKLFFLSMEGQNIKWAEFNVINFMGSNDYLTKRYALLTAHLVLDSQSQGLIMLTNLFKKELQKSSNIVECSQALSCIGSICNKDLGEAILLQIIALSSNTKANIRKKALAVLAKIFYQCPQLIPGNLDKVIQRLSAEENNPTVLACAINLITQVLKVAPSIFPLFLKFIFEQIQKQKSNWLLIKLVRAVNRIIQLEPRFQKKLVEPFTRLLSQTHSKSLQFELVHVILKYFRDQQGLYDSAVDILKSFVDHQDPNIRSLGLELLVQVLESNPQSLNDFASQLYTSFTFGDYFHKIQVMQIFRDYTISNNYNEVCSFYLKELKTEGDPLIKSKITDMILSISQKDKFINIDDPELFFLQYVPQLALRIESVENAIRLKDMIFDLMQRLPDLYQCANKLYIPILNGLLCSKSVGVEDIATIGVLEANTVKNESTPRETLFKTMLMIAAESTRVIELPEVINQINYFYKLTGKMDNEYSFPEMHTLMFKLLVRYHSLIQEKDQSYLSQIIYQNFEINTQNYQEYLVAWVIQKYLQTLQFMHQKETTRSLNIFEKIIISKIIELNNQFNEEFLPSLIETESLQIEQIIPLIRNPKQWIFEISSLKNIFIKELPPIPQDAQKLVKKPENLDLQTPLHLDFNEVQMIKEINDNQQNEGLDKTDQQNIKESIIKEVKQEESSMEQTQQIEVKPKKMLQIQREEVLPPGVTKNDLQRLSEDD